MIAPPALAEVRIWLRTFFVVMNKDACQFYLSSDPRQHLIPISLLQFPELRCVFIEHGPSTISSTFDMNRLPKICAPAAKMCLNSCKVFGFIVNSVVDYFNDFVIFSSNTIT